SMVGLSDGGNAVVLTHNPDDPCRPSVRRLPEDTKVIQPADASFEGEDIDLGTDSSLSIVMAEGIDAEPFLFTPDEGIAREETANRVLTLAEEQAAM
ncbi:MAG: hypothetical protein PHU85_05030, partial [Phycisphaerae bacterium]|nr:hypothetical protein [Phycisphaerae bacterium]